jgi:hypothetical protein
MITQSLSLIIILALTSSASVPAGSTNLVSRLGEVTNEPADKAIVESTGVGEVAKFPVSNVLQNGFVDAGGAEYPPGSEQYYLYSAGMWFGALFPEDSEWIPNVSKAAYNSDMGAMSVPEMVSVGSMGDIAGWGIYLSDMIIPEGYEGEGDFLFVQSGEEPQSYQALWPFADTALNKHLEPGEEINPEEGDIFSDQDSYAVGGDWIPAEDATTLWILATGAYDVRGLGIRIEQRTYSWGTENSGKLVNCIVVNYKIRNMNDFELKSPYFSYFMDPDIGEGGVSPGDDGYWDDFTGYDKERDLAYAYDYNGDEEGWSSPPGYIGVTILEDPLDFGLTGMVFWPHGSEIDDQGTDDLKYDKMISTDFETYLEPNDVRLMANCGPFPDMGPGDEYNFTIAVVVDDTYQKLTEDVDLLRKLFGKLAVEEAPIVSTDGLDIELTTSNISCNHIGLRYSLPRASNIDLAVFDALGRRIVTLYQGHAPAGSSSITWPVTQIPAGVYFVRLQADNQSCTERVLIVR